MESAKVANWLQIVGNLGIVVGLILVAVQIDQASDQVQQSINLSRNETIRQLLLNRVNNEQLRSTYEKLTAGKLNPAPGGLFFPKLMSETGLGLAEVGMLADEQQAWWSYFEQMIVNIDRLSPGQRAALDGGIRVSYGGSSPFRRLWYEDSKGSLNPDAVRYVDNLLLAQSPASTAADEPEHGTN